MLPPRRSLRETGQTALTVSKPGGWGTCVGRGQECGHGHDGAVGRVSTTPPVGGFPLAIVYKFHDDQGIYLAALIAFYGFLSLFPLLLLLTSLLGFASCRTAPTCSIGSSTPR